MRLGTSIGDAEERAMYDRGDVLYSPVKTKAVVQEVLISITHLDIKYRVEWEHSNETVTVPEQALEKAEVVNSMKRPYTWDDGE